MAKKKTRGKDYYYTDEKKKANKRVRLLKVLNELSKKKAKLENKEIPHKIDGEIDRLEKLLKGLKNG